MSTLFNLALTVAFTICTRVIKDLQQWKEAPLDCVILSLHQLQAYYCNEIKRGLSGIGTYTIAAAYASLKIDQLSLEYIPANSPEEIVKRIREGKSNDDVEVCPSVQVGHSYYICEPSY